ncbi:hypothetical protein [Thalassococcus halodurans]|uniref:hypothetical protein n=1 Tax=Thalassococcus halodurans TaxID=373675 RepID=UPI0011AFFFA1|nr:hypothetical protein [Thalassococcus halodurans]
MPDARVGCIGLPLLRISVPKVTSKTFGLNGALLCRGSVKFPRGAKKYLQFADKAARLAVFWG